MDKGGSLCVDCHMPLTVYMARHPRRDHGLTIPDPLLTKEHNVPNACIRCHNDKPLQWSIEAAQRWYGERLNRHTQRRARWIAQARAGEQSATTNLAQMAREERIPLWRAIAVGLLKRWIQDEKVRAVLLESAADPAPLVRGMAARALEPLAPWGNPAVEAALERLAQDSVRSVRIEAGWALRAKLQTNSLAGNDLARHLHHNLDQPSGALQMGVFLLDRGQLDNALTYFRRAVAWDGRSAPLRHALAVGLSTAGQKEAAVSELEIACQLAPRDADLHFNLGLALAEVGKLEAAAAYFDKAIQLDTSFARAWYNLGLARSALGEPERALQALERAESLDPQSADAPYARATILHRNGRLREARIAARRALEIDPARADADQLLQVLEPP
jgi:tetratricopeptide (TPR) repeat protein